MHLDIHSRLICAFLGAAYPGSVPALVPFSYIATINDSTSHTLCQEDNRQDHTPISRHKTYKDYHTTFCVPVQGIYAAAGRIAPEAASA